MRTIIFCFVTPITIPPEETAHLTEMMLNGEDWRGELARLKRGREIKSYPDNFRQWVSDNADKIAAARERGTEPYFIRNNATAIDEILNPDETKALTPLQIAQKRHEARTPEQEDAIRKRWQERNERIEAQKKKDSHTAAITKSYGERMLAVVGDIPGVDASVLKAAIKSGNVELIREEAGKLRDIGKQFKADAHKALGTASDYAEVSTDALNAAMKAGRIKAIWEETKALQNKIQATKDAENALSDLIPNAHSLHQEHALTDLQAAHKELDGVMQKWLSKYGYASLDDAPLQHLKNKLDFELSSPTVNYSQKEIIKKAITEKIRIIEQKIIWNDLVTKASTLRTFQTKSTIYKNHLAQIDIAIHNNDVKALQQAIADAEIQQQKLIAKKIKYGGNTKSALNTEYKGSATGNDITSTVDVRKMTSEDPYRKDCFTNNVARMQGFDAPAKLVTESEFDLLEKACGEVFYRTVNSTTFRGKSMSSAEFASQLYIAERLELNGPGGRVYGDGMYVATSSWNGSSLKPLSISNKQEAYNDSRCYGNGSATISEMTFTRPPRIIKQTELQTKWSKLTREQQAAFGHNPNTFGCALGYDAMLCRGVNYMVIWNRSIIAVKKQ